MVVTNIKKFFYDLLGAKAFKTLNHYTGYLQVRMSEEYKEKTTFLCRYGT